MGVNSYRKELATLAANSFLYEETPFWKSFLAEGSSHNLAPSYKTFFVLNSVEHGILNAH